MPKFFCSILFNALVEKVRFISLPYIEEEEVNYDSLKRREDLTFEGLYPTQAPLARTREYCVAGYTDLALYDASKVSDKPVMPHMR